MDHTSRAEKSADGLDGSADLCGIHQTIGPAAKIRINQAQRVIKARKEEDHGEKRIAA